MAGDNNVVTYNRETEVTTTSIGSLHPLTQEKPALKWHQRHLARVILIILFAGVLAAVIAIAVLLAQLTTKVEELAAEKPTSPTEASFNTTQYSAPLKEGPFRLMPPTVVPTHYELFLHIHLPFDGADTLADKFTTKGSNVAITLKAVGDKVASITLHARHAVPTTSTSGHIKQFDKDKVTVVKKGSNPEETTAVTSVEYQTNDIVVIHLAGALVKDAEYVLKIFFDGVIGDDNTGFYYNTIVKDGKTKYLAATQFQPYRARRAFPCFDEPGFRATFSTTLKYPSRFTMTRTNGQATGAAAVDGIWLTQKHSTTPAMSVYLNAFLVSDFKELSGDDITEVLAPAGTYKVNVIGQDYLIDRGDAAFSGKLGGEMMKALSATYKQSFTAHLSKLDMAALPDKSGAMENWGLVLYGESYLMYQEKVSTADNKRGDASIIGHELAHMVFGNLVTCEWWSDTWLNEGFASYMEYQLMFKTKPSWQLENLYPYWVVRTALRTDSDAVSHPLSNPNVQTLSEISTMFDGITYDKGGSLLHMIKGMMGGPADLDAAITTYVEKYKLKTVVKNNFLDELEKVKSGIKNHLLGWIDKSGYPILTLNRDYRDLAGATDINFTQSRFLVPVGNQTRAPVSASDWHIQLTLTDGTANRPVTMETANRNCWLTTSSGKLGDYCNNTEINYPRERGSSPQADNYIVANLQQYGFFRVNYDLTNWARIIAALPLSVAHPTILEDAATRGQLIDDSFTFARAGILKYEVPLKLIHNVWPSEDNYGALASANYHIGYIERILRGTLHYQAFSDYMKNSAGQVPYNDDRWSVDWKDSPLNTIPAADPSEASYNTVLLNNLIIDTACFYEAGSCATVAWNKFKAWQDNNNTFQPDLRPLGQHIIQTQPLVMCYGVRHGPNTVANWEYLNGLYDDTTLTPANKLAILRAMACTKHEELLQRLLVMATDRNRVRSQDVSTVFSYVARFHAGSTMAWDFLRSEWTKLSGRANIVSTMGAYLKNDRDVRQLRQLQQTAGGKDIPEGPTFERTILQVEANIEWLRQHGKEIADVLATLQPNAASPALEVPTNV
ncbi:Aminopeptidase N [Hypsibius exemplaris]|uniref:Aminopeptidase N n=1 Tax=Hypsibius exemplaris TaxID=2072580 RepID=A0A9X6NCZ0_HYPEX|nr:Aminopeptidase N [Hypsibius exemplaris]